MGDCSSFLCCFNKLNVFQIEIISCSLILSGIGIDYCGISYIPFDCINNPVLKFLFILNNLFFVLLILPLILFFILRIMDVLNDKFTKMSFLLSIIQIVISIFGFIMHLICSLFIVDDLSFYDEKTKRKIEREKEKGKEIEKKLLTSSQWTKTLIIIFSILVIWIILLLSIISESIRIILKINGRYSDYRKAIEEEQNYANANANAEYGSSITTLPLNKKNKKEKIIKENNIKIENKGGNINNQNNQINNNEGNINNQSNQKNKNKTSNKIQSTKVEIKN